MLKEPVNFMDPPKWTKKDLPEVTKSFHNYMVKASLLEYFFYLGGGHNYNAYILYIGHIKSLYMHIMLLHLFQISKIQTTDRSVVYI